MYLGVVQDVVWRRLADRVPAEVILGSVAACHKKEGSGHSSVVLTTGSLTARD